ncbi:hypothetical protein FHS55_002626 [Angulomicrobium tetraedrale]|uniref:Lipoprotein n=1 Tax=Ancylobacter tetraedralis TaxID=217068 RepID=A0A839ZBB5_9HYPH|nr:hypothetical protein [Ancylobacter tetraedralis]MBB3772017.1 hypothetical protein [Ancylobacter tetraedralis]
MKQVVVMALMALGVAGCDSAPPHYLAWCDEKDGQDWRLIDHVKKDGYLLSCTYQSPDRQSTYTRACDGDGCNIR